MFRIDDKDLDLAALKTALPDPGAGACVTFEGWVRDTNEGKDVQSMAYEVYEPLAHKEGERILAEACERFPIIAAHGAHRSGQLAIGECSVWIGVSAAHRDAAFQACRYIIDEIKQRLPIWKKEFYADGDSGWVNCERCARTDSHREAG
jgi:molybdopterin synthase catalytic subunit